MGSNELNFQVFI